MTDLVERLHRYRPIDEWGAGVHHTICDEAAARISQQDAEIERLRREVAELREISVDKARAWDALNATFERGRRKGLSEAAGIAELDADWSAFGKKDIEPWDTGPDAVRDYRLGIVAGRAIAAAIRAKAEDTRT
ncbi:hypothetical protein M2267_003083 [Ensifer sp. KUDG1]|uniref:hypothetical protein n=1 Tax=Ensifer sp. KUDG1 TaxID=3373919 RepID=UPI003D239C60